MIKNKVDLSLVVIMILIIALQLAGCSNKQELEVTELSQSHISEDSSTTEEEDNKDTEIRNNDAVSEKSLFVDNSYKIYYGEWIVKEICGEHERLGKQENAEELIGSKIYFDVDEIRINDVIAITNPEYRISILPSTIDYYIPNMPSHKDLGVKGEFFMFVSVYTGETSNPLLISADFYIKDDKTLILVSNDAYYTLERVDYIPNVEKYYESF